MTTTFATPTTDASPAYRARTRVPIAAALVALAAGVANTVIALAAVAAGAEAIDGLQPQAYVGATVLAAFAGALGWHLINRHARRPVRLVRWLAPTFAAVSVVPALTLVPSHGGAFAGGLVLMHVVTAVIAVATFWRVLPLRAER